jgi:hypothetical protein
MALFSVAETGAAFASPAPLTRFLAVLSNETPDENPMASLPDRREGRARALARFWFVRTSPWVRVCGRLPHPHALRTCFCGMAKSSMFADMPLDNRTVDLSRLTPPGLALLGLLKTSPRVKRSKISSRPIVL